MTINIKHTTHSRKEPIDTARLTKVVSRRIHGDAELPQGHLSPPRVAAGLKNPAIVNPATIGSGIHPTSTTAETRSQCHLPSQSLVQETASSSYKDLLARRLLTPVPPIGSTAAGSGDGNGGREQGGGGDVAGMTHASIVGGGVDGAAAVGVHCGVVHCLATATSAATSAGLRRSRDDPHLSSDLLTQQKLTLLDTTAKTAKNYRDIRFNSEVMGHVTNSR